MNHFLDINQLSREDIFSLFEKANQIQKMSVNQQSLLLQNRSIISIFFEKSTRTRVSFQLAAQRCGANIINLDVDLSSIGKGESTKDTLNVIAAMNPDAIIIRHHDDGFCHIAASWLKNTQIPLINAGDGTNQHPSQTLLDLYTIYRHKPSPKLKVAIIGDILHSRVASSLIDGLSILNYQEIILYGPQSLLPSPRKEFIIAESLRDALDNADVVVMLRVQQERISKDLEINIEYWQDRYGLNNERIKWCKNDAIIMHPGPINRGTEITDEVADGPQSVIFEQVKNGVLMRQTILDYCINF